MSKLPSIVAGVDLGHHALKAVVMRRKAEHYVLSNYAVVPFERPPQTAAEFAASLANLVAVLGSKPTHWSVALMHKEAVIRIVEQPETPREILREALRHSGESLLNHDVHDHVIDCASLRSAHGAQPGLRPYLVGAVPRELTRILAEGFRKVPLAALELEPICLFNAFEFAKPQAFKTESFLILDIGYEASIMIVGSAGQLNLIRSVESGSRLLLERAAAVAGIAPNEVLGALEGGDPLLMQSARVSVAQLGREALNSIAFFEGRSEESIDCVYVSGGVSHSGALLELLSQELDRPCHRWSAFDECELALPAQKAGAFAYDACGLHVACGAAVQLLKGS